jgi:hypothetical protein
MTGQPAYDDHVRLRRAIVSVLQRGHVGRANAIHGPALNAHLRRCGFSSLPKDTRILRDSIAALREAGQPICSDSAAGYWWAETWEEIEITQAEYKARIAAIQRAVNGLERAKETYKPQLQRRMEL